MTNTELLPCPFCGSDDLRQVIHDLSEDDQEPFGYSISCNICFVDLPPEPTPADSIRTWNTRASTPAPVGDVDLDNAREVFEKWITANGDYPHLKHKSFGGNYLHEEVAMKWDGFRAGYYTQPKQSAPVERIEGLAVAISKLASSDYGDRPLCDNEYIVIKAARAYLKLQGG